MALKPPGIHLFQAISYRSHLQGVMMNLVELDSLEVLVIVDNELDPISPCPTADLQQSGGIRDICMRGPIPPSDVRRAAGAAALELRMDNICCGAHGLSLMITGVRDGQSHTILFDTGPEEHVWERNAKRLRADVGRIEMIQLSHWHKDHSGGMLKVLEMVNAAKAARGDVTSVHVDLHPGRPDFRGVQAPGFPVVSLEADPTFDDITKAKGIVEKHDKPHTVLENMFLISGEIPRITEYEKGFSFGVRFDATKSLWEQDEQMADERLLMCKIKDKGIVVFTGCSHAGVVNASKHAAELGQGAPLHAIIGGFHLADAQPTLIQDTVKDLKALGPNLLLPGHCTGWRAKFELNNQMPECLVPCSVGSSFVL